MPRLTDSTETSPHEDICPIIELVCLASAFGSMHGEAFGVLEGLSDLKILLLSLGEVEH